MRKHLVVLGVMFGLVMIFASATMAHFLNTATATVNCTTYTITANMSDLGDSSMYTVDYSISVTCDGMTIPINSSFNFNYTGPLGGAHTAVFTGYWQTSHDPLTSGCQVTPGMASLVGSPSGPINITINGSTAPVTINCSTTTGACTTAPESLVYNVSEGSKNASEIVWFNSHFKLQGTVPSTDFEVDVTDQLITFGSSTLIVPDARITFSSAVSCANTTFVAGVWRTVVPLSYATHADEIFSAGLAYELPPSFPQNVHNVSWNATFSSPTAPSLQFAFQYGAANYLSSDGKGDVFPMTGGGPDYNAMMIDPVHNAPTCNGYNGGDHAGTPEDSHVKNLVTGGGSGGGGSNWTGSWSSTPTYICATP